MKIFKYEDDIYSHMRIFSNENIIILEN